MKLEQLSELFEQAIQIENPQEQMEFIQLTCDDLSSREKLVELVRAHRSPCRIVDDPDAVIDVARNLEPDKGRPKEGDRIGAYRLLEQIGEGGMGYVFMADQTRPIRRRVAIKVIKPEANSNQVLARFDAEREALTRLDHPNVTQILDAGVTDQGLPYFVMELVRGDSLIEFCDRNKLSIRQRIELLEKVCLAVHHAHQKGILHRDIKPSNVMVTLHDGAPVPKVIDFGIAKALDRPLTTETLFTRYGDMVGTPQYMSPEQAEKSGLDLDVRTDIYSLGVLLYELLTGTTPIEEDSLKGKGLLGILETVRDCDTESPSLRVTRTLTVNEAISSQRNTNDHLLQKLIRGELDWITLKALSKDRANRYESAAAMARDLRRYLNGDSVEAAAPTFLYLGMKLFRKHRAICIALGCCALLLIAVSIVSVGWAVTNGQLRKVANDNAVELAEKSQHLEKLNAELMIARDRAKQAEKQALSLVNEKKRQAAEERATNRYLIGMLSNVEPKSILVNGQPARAELDDLEPVLQLIKSTVEAIETGESAAFLSPSPDIYMEAEPVGLQIHDPIFGEPRDGSLLDLALSPLGAPSINGEPSLLELVLEEYRKEFGTEHEMVAACLVAICHSHLHYLKNDWAKIESHSRETLAITSQLSQDIDDRLFLELQAKCLLVKALTGQHRVFEAKEQLADAQASYQNQKALLNAEQQERIEDLLPSID